MLRLSLLGTAADTRHDDFDVVDGRGPIDIVHDQSLWIAETRLGIEAGITRRFGASLMLPLRSVTTAITYRDATGAEVMLANDNIHHRDETVTGLGDPMLLGTTAFTAGAWRIGARAGLTVPIGRTEDDPFALGEMGLPHQHIQFGTGTVNPVVAADIARSWGDWRLGAFGLTQQVFYPNDEGFQAGDRYAVGVALRRRLTDVWNVRAMVDALGETAERWDGQVPTDDGNRGRFDLIFGAGASIALGASLGLDVALKIPAITHAVGGQLEMPAIVELGVSWTFGATPPAPHADEHEHEHGHAHGEHGEHGAHGEHGHDDATAHGDADAHGDASGLDIVDLGPPGAAVDLVPVPGKITIFDFWATWCEPCKTLEPALVELVRAHPGRVALRRIDAVDWDSAAVAKYLTPKAYGLPHVRVFDANGRLVLERSSDAGQLGALIDAIRAIVEPKSPVKPGAAIPSRVVPVVVTANGFEPADVRVPAGQPITLRFTRRFERTCATEVVMTVGGQRIVKDLPLGKTVDVTVTLPPGKTSYTCAMDMIGGTLTAE